MALSVNVRKEIGHAIETKEFLGLVIIFLAVFYLTKGKMILCLNKNQEALKMISYCNFQGNRCTSSM